MADHVELRFKIINPSKKFWVRQEVNGWEINLDTWNIKSIVGKENELARTQKNIKENLAIISKTKKEHQVSDYVKSYAVFYSSVI